MQMFILFQNEQVTLSCLHMNMNVEQVTKCSRRDLFLLVMIKLKTIVVKLP